MIILNIFKHLLLIMLINLLKSTPKFLEWYLNYIMFEYSIIIAYIDIRIFVFIFIFLLYIWIKNRRKQNNKKEKELLVMY